MAAPGLVSPDSYPARDPRDTNMLNGRTANPPRMYELGGAYRTGIWNKEVTPTAFAQMGQSNIAHVEKPTSVKSSHRSSRKSD